MQDSAAVVGCGLRVDEKTVDFGSVELEGSFECRDDCMYARHGEIVG